MIKKIVHSLCIIVCVVHIQMISSSVYANISQPGKDLSQQARDDSNNNIDEDYIYDWAEQTTQDPEIEMIRSLSDCATTASITSLCEGGSFTVTHGTSSCCDGNAHLRYYNAYTGVWTDGSVGVDQYTSSVSNASPGSYTFQTRIYGVNESQYCSSSETVNVYPDPSVTISADNTDVCVGGSITLTAHPNGGIGSYSYQWQENGSNISGATGSTYSVPTGSTHSDGYSCYVTTGGVDCGTGYSNSITIQVHSDPSITNPTGATICPGESHTMSVSASGGIGSHSYQWQYYNGSSWVNISGATGTSYTASPGSTTQYRCFVTTAGSGCGNDYSSSATVTVQSESNNPSSASANPEQIDVGDPSTLTVSGGSLGAGAQWVWYTGGCGGTQVGVGSSIDVYPTATTTYYVRAEGTCNQTPCVSVTVYVTGAVTICEGDQIEFSRVGGSLGYDADWEWYRESCGGTHIGSGQTINVTPAFTTTYHVRAEGECNNTSCANMSVIVNSESTPPSAISGTDQDICEGGSSTLSVEVPATITGGVLDYTTWTLGSGSAPGFNQNGTTAENERISSTDPWGNTTVVWEAQPDATSNADGGWNTSNFSVDNTKTYRYSVWVWRNANGNGNFYLGCHGYGSTNGVIKLSDGSNQTNPYFISSSNVPQAGRWELVVGHVYPAGYGGTTNHPESGRYTVDDGRVGNIANDYKWRPETTSGNFRTYLYYCTNTSVRQRFVYPRVDVVDGTEPSIAQLLEGLDPNRGLGTNASWNWYSGSCGGTFEGTGTSINVTPSSTTTYYVRAEGICNTTSCVNYTVNVAPDPDISISANPTTICEGGDVSFTQSASGGSGTIVDQWQHSTDGNTWTDWTQSSNPTYTNLTQSLYFRCVRSATDDGCNDGISNVIFIDVETDPSILTQPDDPTPICAGGTTDNMSVVVSGGTGSFSYQWQYFNGSSWQNVSNGTPSGASYSGSTGNSFSVSGISTQGSYDYRCIISQAGSGCDDLTTNTVTVVVHPDPDVSISGATTICSGGSASLSSTANNGTGSETYQWQDSPDGSSWSDISGATDDTYQANNLTSTTYFRVQYGTGGSGCNTATSNVVIVTVVNDPAAPTATKSPNVSDVCAGTTLSLTGVTDNGGGTGSCDIEYCYSTDGGSSFSSWSTSVPSFSGVAGATNIIRIRKNCSGVGCDISSEEGYSWNVVSDPTISITTGGNQSICYGDDATGLTASISDGVACTYQWQSSSDNVNWSNISGATNSNYTPTGITETTFFRCVTENCQSGCGQDQTGSILIEMYNDAIAEGTWVGDTNTDWFECTNWGNGRVPTSTMDVTIPAGCTYYPDVNTPGAVCNRLTVQNGGNLTVSSGDLTVNDGFYKENGGTANFPGGTTNVHENYLNYGTSGETRVNGGNLNVGTAASDKEFINYDGQLYVTSGSMDCGRYLYNYNGYTNNYVNVSGGSVTADKIPNYEGNIYHSGGAIISYGYYRENDSGGGNYYGSGSANFNFNGNSYIRLMCSGSYFNDVNINGDYYVTTDSNFDFDIYGDLDISAGNSLDMNDNNMLIAGDYNNIGSFTAGTSLVNFNGNLQQDVKTNGDSFYDVAFNNTNGGDADVVLTTNDMTVTHSAAFTDGIVNTGTNTFVFGASATTNIGTVTSFVDGPVEKTSAAATFTFPTGNVNSRDIGAGMQTYRIWAPFTAIPAASTNINVRYFFSNDNLHPWWYHDWTHEYPLTHTTDREYWLVNSSQDLDVSLYWRDNDPCSIHDFCNGGSQLEYLTTAYWDNIWKDAGGDASGENTINGDISSFISVPFSAKGERQITFGGTNKDIPLPVELLNFKAVCDAEKQAIDLTWSTASETNNDYFTLYRSKTGLDFEEIASVDGYGNISHEQTYTYTDNDAPSGDVYYKLSQTDLDGTREDLNIISVNCFDEDQQYDLKIYPNPVTEELNIVFGNWPAEVSSITIHDMSGRVILQKKLDNIIIGTHIKLRMDDIAPGMYMLWLQSDTMNKNIKIEKH